LSEDEDSGVWAMLKEDYLRTQERLDKEEAAENARILAIGDKWIDEVRAMNPKPYRSRVSRGRIGFTTPITDPEELREWERRREAASQGKTIVGSM
jgi:hypothetical protein